MKYFNIIAALISFTSAATILSASKKDFLGATPPASDGKFFYTDMRAGGQ